MLNISDVMISIFKRIANFQESYLRTSLGMSGRHRDSDPARKSISVERTFTPTADVEQIKGKHSMKIHFGRYFSSHQTLRTLSKRKTNRIILVVHFPNTIFDHIRPRQ